MTRIAYEILDVFTDQPFAGNPLAVIADGRDLDGAQMQAIGREFNLSETVFVLPPQTEAGFVRLRIFTPGSELPFAGHPTIGTAVALARRGEAFGRPAPATMVLEEGVGPIPVTVTADGPVHRAALTTDSPFQDLGPVPVALAAACLGLSETRIAQGKDAPRRASKGLPYALVQLTDADALAACQPEPASFLAADRAMAHPDDRFAIAAWRRAGPSEIAMRMFAPLSGIPEDPATGSAAAALAAYLCASDGGPIAVTIRQGVEMGRPSVITARAEAAGPNGSRVEIAGAAVPVMAGTLTALP